MATDTFVELMQVWSNWVEGTYSNIVDPRINTNVDSTVMKSLIQIGLLCIQDGKDRPTMEEVVGMLIGTSSIDLPIPTFIGEEDYSTDED